MWPGFFFAKRASRLACFQSKVATVRDERRGSLEALAQTQAPLRLSGVGRLHVTPTFGLNGR